MKAIFDSTIQKYKTILERNQKKYNATGYIKLALFILFAVNIYFMITRWDTVVFKISATALLIIQLFAWIYQARLDTIIKHAAGIMSINQRHVDRITGKWTTFPDTGKAYFDLDHPYCSDLDIVGEKSLFQFINTTHTWHGRETFAHDLLHPQFSKEVIKGRQEAVKELSEAHGLTDELEYQFSQIGTDPAAAALVDELETMPPFLKNKVLKTLLVYGSLVIFLFILSVVAFKLQPLYLTAIILFVLQTFIWVIGVPATHKYLKAVNRLPLKLERYSEAIKQIDAATFTAKNLQKIKSDLATSDLSAAKAMKALSKITSKASIRRNAIISFILNTLLLWDYRCAFNLQDWVSSYGPHCRKWFSSLGEMESLLSFSTFHRVCSHTCFPDLSDQRGIQAEEMGHPLITGENRVTNPLQMQDDITIISGSNMSGKTTYLRTVGINIVLARAGSPVCAKKMICSDLHIITSMRIADDLSEGISTFYAELKRIKGVLDAAKNDSSTLFLIDEIFRGTNSVDRLTGAKTVIARLSQMGAIGMITTHDLELCDLEYEIHIIKNASFSEHYKQNEICFDYQIRDGKSKTTNAKYLMELVGIL